MSHQLNKLCLALTAAGILAASSNVSATNGILAYGNGMIAHGVGGAGVANASEAMSGVDNPALIARVGASWALGSTYFLPNAAANVGNGYVDSDADSFIVPQGAWYTSINDSTVAGVSISALGGIATDYPAQLFGAPVNVDLQGIIIAPAISMNVTDRVSVGGAINFGAINFETEGPGVNGLPRNDDDDSTGFGFEIGVAIDVGPNTTIGVDYQSEIDLDVMDNHAEYIFAESEDKQLTLPALTTVGITHQINDSWKVIADITDAPWSNVELIEEIFGWEDQTIYKIGFEKQVSDSLAVRFGYNHADSPIPDNRVVDNLLAPVTTEDHYTIGFTKNLAGGGSLSGYYARVPNGEQSQAGGPGGFPFLQMDQHALGLSYHIEF